MNAAELFERAPLGSLVTYSDGTPRPPDRHKRKLAEWQRRNGSGYLFKVTPGTNNPARPWDVSTFMLREWESAALILNRHYQLTSRLDFQFTPPAPGSILAASRHDTPGNPLELSHLWRDLNEARDWASRKRYNLENCGLVFFIISDYGKLVPYNVPEVTPA